MVKITVISYCQTCGATIIAEVDNKEWVHDLKYICSECLGTDAQTVFPYIRGFRKELPAATVDAANTYVPYKSAEEKALEQLKEFCIVGE